MPRFVQKACRNFAIVKAKQAAFKRATTSRIEIANMYVQLQATCTNDLGSGSFSSHSHTQLHKINLSGQ